MLINVFVSRPTVIDDAFESAYGLFDEFLKVQGFVMRRLGRSDYSRKAPLLAVMDIIEQCCGTLVLGYPQTHVRHEIKRSAQVLNSVGYLFPSTWNQIEGALAFRSKRPVLVVAHPGIEGGVFDHGVTGECVLHVDLSQKDWFQQALFSQPFGEWRADVERIAGDLGQRI